MSTFADLQQRVNTDFLNRQDFTDQTKRSILAAVRHYEKRPWWFNETATALTTTASQGHLSLPSNFLIDREMRILISGANDQLIRRNLQFINDMNIVNTVGVPTHYALFRDRIELALVPDTAYTVTSYYIKSLPVLSADADTNVWTNEFQDVIAFHAAKLMWATVIRNDNEAQKYAMLEKDALTSMDEQNEQFKFSSIKPTRF